MIRLGRYALLAALVLVILYPTAILVYLAFWSSPPGMPGVPTLQRFHDAFTASGFGRSVVNTAIFAVTKAALADLIGGGLAFLVARTDLPARRTAPTKKRPARFARISGWSSKASTFFRISICSATSSPRR